MSSFSTHIYILWLLIMAHGATDAGQGQLISERKQFRMPDDSVNTSWPGFLCGHAAINGLGVFIVVCFLGRPDLWWLSALEAVLHVWIDFGSINKAYGLFIDQCLHFACKLLYVAIICNW